jgi:TENA/THI-4/PQQC family
MAGLSQHLFQLGQPHLERQLAHPTVRGIAAGDLEPTRFRAWLIQDYLFLVDYVRLFALAAARARLPDQPWPRARLLGRVRLMARLDAGCWPLGYESFEHHSAACSPVQTGPSTRALGDYPPAAVPPCSWPCRLVS